MKIGVLAAALALAGCDRDAPPAPSAEQSGQLNEAEDMLNGMAENQEGPATEAADPSHNQN